MEDDAARRVELARAAASGRRPSRLAAGRRLRQVRLEIQRLVRVGRRRGQRVDLHAAELDERAGRLRLHLARAKSRFGHCHGVVAVQIERLVVLVAEIRSVERAGRSSATPRCPVIVPSRIAEPGESGLIGQLAEAVRDWSRRRDTSRSTGPPRRARSGRTPGRRCRGPSPSPGAACRGGSRTVPGCRPRRSSSPAISLTASA